jgi:hypothetical protein
LTGFGRGFDFAMIALLFGEEKTGTSLVGDEGKDWSPPR